MAVKLKVPAFKADHLPLLSRTASHKMERENWLP